MKKLITTLFSLALGVSLSFAQTSGGPDAFGYTWRNSSDPNGPVFNWIDIDNLPGTVTVTGLADDNIVGPVIWQVPFQYYWYNPDRFWIGSNGYLGFTNTPVAHPFPTIPNPTQIQNYLAIMTTDLTFTDANSQPIPTASCKYWISPALDSLVITWKNVPFWASGSPGYSGNNTFQAILTTTDSSITYQYLDQTGASQSTTQYVSTGIENNSGNIGLQVLYEVYPLSGTAVKFYYPASTTLAIFDAATNYCNNEDNGGLFLSRNGAGYSSTAEIRNAGNQTLTSFNVYSRVVNAANGIQVRDTIQVTNLAPQQTQLLNFPDVFVPSGAAGVYRHITETLLTGDATPSNNSKTLELQVVDTTAASILLSFDSGVAAAGGLSWTGGNGGGAIHFVPPFTPCLITSVRAWIVANPNLVSFSLQIFDDDGPNGAPLTRLDSVNITAVTTGAWNEAILSTPLLIPSGGFYVAWIMGGDGISLGQNQVAPFSNRTYEVLGNAGNPGNWAAYRYREIEDLMINARISIPTGINEIANTANVFSEFNPNPATHTARIAYKLEKEVLLSYELLNIHGQVVKQQKLGRKSGSDAILVNVNDLSSGIYLCKITAGTEQIVRKLNVLKD